VELVFGTGGARIVVTRAAGLGMGDGRVWDVFGLAVDGWFVVGDFNRARGRYYAETKASASGGLIYGLGWLRVNKNSQN
jgi:hypothetical protein